ncbi:MAG TPA: TetR/AcrR family transcriptional regulator [Ktedonobacteraceae bacterium]|nr:TetR/AcrR family transcriptional regulator [Ktedonobacteraceae bacterium]
MVRTVNEQEYAVRRNNILDAVQRLMYSKGYEQMTIQDILDDLQISKGAFYHYFDSKQAVLSALLERMIQEVEQILLSIVHDPALPAIDKLQRFFASANQWKIAQKSFLLAFLRVWYADDNAFLRQKMHAMRVKALVPLLTTIIHRGIQEGVFTTSYPDQAARVIVALIEDLGDNLVERLLSDEAQQDSLSHVEHIIAGYSDVLERLLGAPKGSLPLADVETLKEWFATS